MKTVIIDNNISIEDIIKVSRLNYQVKLSDVAINRIKEAREYIDNLDNLNTLKYGINTGLGDLCDTLIDKDVEPEYQKNILLSHACGSGDSYSNDIVRAAILLLMPWHSS